jgi:cytochrome c oxidase subunit 2
MPPEGSAIAGQVDTLYAFLLIVSFISCVLVIGGLIFFAIKYRRKHEGEKTPYIDHNSTLEFLWSFIPFVIFMVAFGWGWLVYYQLRTVPENGLEIAVQGQKWNWTFTYKNGRASGGEFYVPVDQPVRLVLSATDVLHSFYLPAFRTKQDAVPGRYTQLWFKPQTVGRFHVFCAEYCGDQHSGMHAIMNVVPRAQYEEWLGNDPYKGLPPIEVGKKVFASRCVACHTLTDAKGVGPSFKGIWGHEVAIEGGTVKVDENYIRESILDPNAKTVSGFPKGVMPTFAGQLNDQEIMGVIEMIKSLE